MAVRIQPGGRKLIHSHHSRSHETPDVRNQATIAKDHDALVAGSHRPGDKVCLTFCFANGGDTDLLFQRTKRRAEGLKTVFTVRDARVVTTERHDRIVEEVQVRLEYAAGWHDAHMLRAADAIGMNGMLVSDGERLILAQHDQDGLTPPTEIVDLAGPALHRHGSVRALAALCSQHALRAELEIRITDAGAVIVCEDTHPATRPDGNHGKLPVQSAPIFDKASSILEHGPDPDRMVYATVLPDRIADLRREGLAGLVWGTIALAGWHARKVLEVEADEVVYLGVPLSSLERLSGKSETSMGTLAFAGGSGPIDGVVELGTYEQIWSRRAAA